MFSGIDFAVLLLVVMFVFYLANPKAEEVEIKIDPIVMMIVVVTVLMFAVSL